MLLVTLSSAIGEPVNVPTMVGGHRMKNAVMSRDFRHHTPCSCEDAFACTGTHLWIIWLSWKAFIQVSVCSNMGLGGELFVDFRWELSYGTHQNISKNSVVLPILSWYLILFHIFAQLRYQMNERTILNCEVKGMKFLQG